MAASALLLCGCAGPPPDLAGVQVFFICAINCPLSVTMVDEGQATDAVPAELPHLAPASVYAIRGVD